MAWTPEFMGFGNVLLVALWAHEQTVSGRPTYTLATPATDGWFDPFPTLRPCFLQRHEVRLTDRRVMPWTAASKAAAPDEDPYRPIDMEAVERFLRDVLLPGSVLAAVDSAADGPDTLVLNVRRGDYYSDPDVRGQYGFDLETYLRLAVQRSCEADGDPRRIVVVSDGLDWCRARLGWLGDAAPVDFASPVSAVDDFVRVASATRIIVTNSTFSYWAAYVSNMLHGGTHAQVWAPRFFDRSRNGGRGWLLDERWSVVEDIPGGWDS